MNQTTVSFVAPTLIALGAITCVLRQKHNHKKDVMAFRSLSAKFDKRLEEANSVRAQQNKVIKGLKSDRWGQIDLIKGLNSDRAQQLETIVGLKTELEALQASKVGHLRAQVCKYKGDTTKRVERLGLCVIVETHPGFYARSVVHGLRGLVCVTPTQAKRQFESLLGLSGRVNWGKQK